MQCNMLKQKQYKHQKVSIIFILLRIDKLKRGTLDNFVKYISDVLKIEEGDFRILLAQTISKLSKKLSRDQLKINFRVQAEFFKCGFDGVICFMKIIDMLSYGSIELRYI